MTEAPEETVEENEETSETEETVEEKEDTADVAEAFTKLSEKFKQYQDGERSNKDILRLMLEDDINTDLPSLVKLTKIPQATIARMKGPIARKLKEKARLSKIPPAPPLSSTEAEGAPGKGPVESVYRTETNPTEILKNILETHPDINSKQITEILSWANMTPGGMHPTHLQALLVSFKGIDNRLASIISQKYSLALNKATIEAARAGQTPGVYGLPVGQQPAPQYPYTATPPQQPTWPQNWRPGWPQQPQQPQVPPGYVPPGYIRAEDARKMVEDTKKENKLDNLAKGLSDLKTDLPRIIAENTPQKEKDYETVEIFMDEQGNQCMPDKAVTVRRVSRPIDARGSKDDFFEKYIKMKNAGLIGETKTPGAEDPAIKRLDDKIASQEQKYEQLKDKMTEDQRTAMTNEIQGLKTEVAGLRTSLASSGVNSPEGVIAVALQEAGKKEPVKTIAQTLEKLATGGTVEPLPPGSQPGKRGTPLLEAARQKGLVTTIRERVRGRGK